MRLINRLSIRTRIAVGTFLLAALFFAGAALVVQAQVQGILAGASAELLQTDAAPYEAALQSEPAEHLDRPGEGELVAVVAPDGTTALSSLPAALESKLATLVTIGIHPKTVTGKVDYLVRSEAVENTEGTWHIVTARSEAANRLVLAGLTRGLIISLTVLTMLFGVASWALTGAALRPVTRLRLSAESIVATGSEELLPSGPAQDEVSDLAATLNHLIGDLRAAAEREKQLVSDASHELRTPLAILEAQLELMGGANRATAATDLEAAQRAARRLSVLVANLLELSQLESDSTETSTPVSAIVDELAAAIDRARLSAASTGVTIDYDASAADAAGTVAISAHDFGRVVDNLVGNSVKAIVGTGRVDVTLAADDAALVLSVTDSGPGVPEEFLPRAFDRFSRADEARASADGTGLGLAIVAAAVEGAHGTVSLANREGGGVEALVSLPVTPGA